MGSDSRSDPFGATMNNDLWRRTFVMVNVGLAATAVLLAVRKFEPAPVTTATSSNAAPKPSPARIAPSDGFPGTANVADQRRWLIEQLRAMGVPNRVLARVVLKDLDQRWNKQAAEVSLKYRGDPEVLTNLNLQIERSRDAEMRAALGEAGFREWDRENMRREINTGKVECSPAETDAAYALWKKLQQRDLDLRELKFQGKIDQVGLNDEYARDLADFQQQLKKLLGDGRYAQSQASGAQAANAYLRRDLAGANLTPAQFDELLQTQQQYNDLRADLARQPRDDADYVQSLKDLDEARDEEYRRVLGSSAFDSLQKQQDAGYAEMKKYQSQWGLDDAKVDYVYGALKYYQKSADDYQASIRALAAQGQAVDWDSVNKNLEQFAQQTRQTLQSYLGQASFDHLEQNGIVHLTQPPGNLPNSNNGRRF